MAKNTENWRWHTMSALLKDNAPLAGAEIGVKEGRFVQHMLKVFPDLTMYAVDPWEAQPKGNETYLDWNFNLIYNQYKTRTAPYADRVIELREYSQTAAEKVKDRSLDFVFLDAQHDYESIKQDIKLWSPKVKRGGLLSGHDHDDKFPGVVRAVGELVKDRNLAANGVWYHWA